VLLPNQDVEIRRFGAIICRSRNNFSGKISTAGPFAIKKSFPLCGL
jgi:hypothetical protein